MLVIAALLTAMGTDTMAQAGVAVRAEAVVDVAERMATRFSRAFAREVHQPAIRQQTNLRPARIVQQTPPVRDIAPPRSPHQHEHLLYLPPPALA